MRFILDKTSGGACAMPGAIVTEDRRNCFIEIADLEELIAFADKCGTDLVVITGADGEPPTLEIYDTYREV